MATARGHKVIVFEAGETAGGQVRLASRAPRRKELIGIVDWRLAEIARGDSELRFGTYATAEDVLAAAPDFVLLATGGLPQTPELAFGADLTVSSWDILSGQIRPGHHVLVYDDNGGYPGLSAAELMAEAGAEVEIVTPERFFAPEMGGLNHAAFAASFQRRNVRLTINSRLVSVRRDGNSLVATLGGDYADTTSERRVDQIVVEHGTLPLTELYDALKPRSLNRGEIDYPALRDGAPQSIIRNAEGSFRLIRIGDAVASRNIHAAIYDGIRFTKDI